MLNLTQTFLAATLLGILTFSQQGASDPASKCAVPQEESDATYSPGQVWSYRTRPGEASSTLTILRVERTPKLGVIVHVRVNDIRLNNCTGGPSPTTIAHAPFAKAAIDKSVVHILRLLPQLPDFADGYADWRAHCGGAYTLSVADMVAADELTFNSGLGCTS